MVKLEIQKYIFIIIWFLFYNYKILIKVTLKNNHRKTIESAYATALDKQNEKLNETNDFNIDSVMVEMIFRPLINRLIDMKNEIKNDENLVIFC